MPWNKYYTSKAESVTFIFGELFYYDSFLVTEKLTNCKESYASYLDRQNRVFSEHTWTEEEEKKAEIGYKFFTNQKKVKAYIKKTLEIISKVNQLKKEIDHLPVNRLATKQILGLVKKSALLYNESMGYYFLSQPEYTAKLNRFLLRELNQYVPDNKLQEKFLILIKSDRPTCLEEERKDWLQKISIPYKKGKLDPKELSTRITFQINLYKYLPASSQFGTWDKKHYQKLLQAESTKSLSILEHELKEINSRGLKTRSSQLKIVESYQLPQSLLEKIKTIRVLSWLRLEAHLKGWAFLLYLGPLLVSRTAVIFNLPKEDVFNLTFPEFIKLLKGNFKLTAAHRKRRGGNILALITPEKGYEVFWGKEAERKYQAELAEKIALVSEFFGQAASGRGKIRGRAFVFKWGEKDIDKKIYNFPEGRILVAGQTMPQFMPAIYKAKAIITDEGGMLCHAAIVSRELKIPAIIGTKVATEILKDGDELELDLDKGRIIILK